MEVQTSARVSNPKLIAPKRSDDPLELYFQEVTRHPVLAPDEEQRTAREVVRLRDIHWRTILSYPPFLEPIVALARTQLGRQVLASQDIHAGLRARRQYARHRTKTKLVVYERCCTKVAEVLAAADTDGIVADMVAADLLVLLDDRPGRLNLDVRRPPKGSAAFSEYALAVQRTGSALRVVRNQFVTANLRLVATIAHRFRGGGLPLEDLIQAGNEGLIKAVHRFDPDRGFRFSTYAAWWIRHGVTRAIVNRGRTVRIPAHLHATRSKLRKTRRHLRATLGREPSREELAEACGLEDAKVDEAERAFEARIISTEQPATEDGGATIGDMLADFSEPPLPERFDDAQSLRRALNFLDALSSLEVSILTKRFALDGDRRYTLQEIGDEHGLSRERIRQIQNRALAKLRRLLESGLESVEDVELDADPFLA